MPELAIDYDWVHPNPKQISKYHIVLRYLPKIGKKEVHNLHVLGMSIALVSKPGSVFGGGGEGAEAANNAITEATRLGYGKGATIFTMLGEDDSVYVRAYYSTFAGIIQSRGYTPGAHGSKDVIFELIYAGYSGIWWEDSEDPLPTSSLYRKALEKKSTHGMYGESVIVTPFPVWGPTVIPDDKS